MELNDFVEITRRIECFYGKDLTTEQSRVWYEELQTMSKEHYIQVVKECFRTCKNMPKLSEIVAIRQKTSISFGTDNIKTKLEECDMCNRNWNYFLHKVF